MVDFRYHLVTIIGIFLALALGIVVGTTQLNGQVLDDLNGQIKRLASDKRDLERKNVQEQKITDSQESLISTVAKTVVSGALTGERIVILSTPNAPSSLRSELVPLLEAAGATIGTQVTLRPDLIDPTKAELVQGVVDKAATSSVDREGNAAAVAGRELAEALLVPSAATSPAVTEKQAAATLDDFGKSDLIDVQGKVRPRGTLAVLLTGEAVAGADPQGVTSRLTALLSIAGALDKGSKGLVISGPLAAVDDGGLLKALRQLPLHTTVSSVDGVDHSAGRIATVLALREQRRGDSGQYGTGSDSDGPLPPRNE